MATQQQNSTESAKSSSARTVYESKSSSSYNAEVPMITYRPSIASRNLIIQRTSSSGTGASRQQERAVQYGGLSSGPQAGAYANITSTGVIAVKQSRDKEKKDMQDLNERFASYIEKVRFLEAQNRKLADELEKLKAKWGKETTAIKAMYQAELDEARKCLDEADKDKARLEIRVASLEEQLEELRMRFEEANRAVLEERERNDRLSQQLSDYDAELNPLRRRIETLERDKERDKKQIATLQEALNRTRTDLDNETLLHIDAENRRQTLEEEIEFLKAVHEQELKELAALAYRDTTAENREYWKNEMGQALREIHQLYDDKMEGMRSEMETFYNMKTQEFRTGAAKQNMESVHAKEESKTLRSQVTDQREKLGQLEAKLAQLMRELEDLRREKEDKERQYEGEINDYKMELSKLRAEMEAILKELQNLMDSKLGLELEIAAYRKLLEGEESRAGLRQLVDSIGQTNIERSQHVYSSESSSSGFAGGSSSSAAYGGGSSSAAYGSAQDGSARTSTVTKGEMSAKTTYQRSAKGPVAIAECSADGKYIALENTGRKDEDIKGWKVRRNIDGIDRADFTLDVVLAPGSKFRIWAKGMKPGNAPPTDLEYNESSWGVGGSIVTKLVNAVGEDRATHIQRTTYS